MKHLDLFSGIGGFSLAVDTIFHEQKNQHIFVEWDEFCTESLKSHWPEATYHKDIRQFVTDTKSRIEQQLAMERKSNKKINPLGETYLLTGGFPCQPFSQAGRRKGTADDRYLWPSMLECISLFRPEWVIAENVSGLITWSDGMVLETVCSDMEKEGYEVQPFVIPAVSVGAPHRRDRVWIVAHSQGERKRGCASEKRRDEKRIVVANKQKGGSFRGKSERCVGIIDAYPSNSRLQGIGEAGNKRGDGKKYDDKQLNGCGRGWNENWLKVASELCGVDDGLPIGLDKKAKARIYKAVKYFGTEEAERVLGGNISLKRVDPWRSERLKALGNAIVPQVVAEILRVIKHDYTSS